jgi:protein-disulfide isomerase
MLWLRFLAPAAVAAALLVPQPAPAQSFTEQQKGEIHKIIREYLLANPDVLEEVSAELNKRQAIAEAAKQASAVKKHSEALFNSARGVFLGNREGDVSFVEFFDYNCGFCKRAHLDKLELIRTDSKLKVVLKELPVLGSGSLEAAQVAVAVRMQDASGAKYLAFHRGLMRTAGPANKASALAAAREAGLDVERIERDLTSAEIKASIDESRMLASALGINATPSFVIGDSVTVGAVGLAKLAEKIASARR